MESVWSIVFEGPTEVASDDLNLNFYDIREIFGNYVGFESSIFEELVGNFEKFEHYHAVSNIKEAKSPEQEDFSDKPIVALLGVDQNNLKFGILLYALKPDAIILGLWPKQFFDAVRDDEKILVGTLVAFLKAPDNWRRVDLVISNMLKMESKEKEE